MLCFCVVMLMMVYVEGGGMLPGLLCALCFHRNKLLNVAEYVVGCIMNNHRNNLHALYTYTEYDFPYHIIADV